MMWYVTWHFYRSATVRAPWSLGSIFSSVSQACDTPPAVYYQTTSKRHLHLLCFTQPREFQLCRICRWLNTSCIAANESDSGQSYADAATCVCRSKSQRSSCGFNLGDKVNSSRGRCAIWRRRRGERFWQICRNPDSMKTRQMNSNDHDSWVRIKAYCLLSHRYSAVPLEDIPFHSILATNTLFSPSLKR